VDCGSGEVRARPDGIINAAAVKSAGEERWRPEEVGALSTAAISKTVGIWRMTDEFWRLVKRYNQIGCLLPDPDCFDPHDAAALAEAKVLLAELARVRSEIDAYIEQEAHLNA
jgi:hypothetical protein